MEITTRKQLIEFIENATLGQIADEFGAYRTNFYPFEECYTDRVKRLVEISGFKDEDFNNDSIDINEFCEIEKEDLVELIEGNYTAIFKGTGYTFSNKEQLERFCKIADNDD